MMTSVFAAVADFIALHPHVTYAVVFLLTVSASMPVTGVFIPGSTAIFAAGTLVPSGLLSLWPLSVAATAGAVVGDGLAFWLGRQHHVGTPGHWPLERYAGSIARSEVFLARHGRSSLLLARFIPGVRAFVPFLAGAQQMPAWRFHAANIVSALAWAALLIFLGVFAGASFGYLGTEAEPLAILLAILFLVLWAFLIILRSVLRRGIPFGIARARQLRAWASTHDTWLGRALHDLLDPARHEAKTLAVLAALLIGNAWLFLGILEDVVSGDRLVRTDAAIYRALQDLRTTSGDSVMIAVTEMGDTAVVLPITILIFLWLAWKRAWRTAIYWLVAIAGASALNTAIKAALHRTRPGEVFYSGWSAFSFPSGHSTVNIVLYGFLSFLIAREVRPAWRVPIAFSAACLVFLVAFSRLYLGAHWFSDVMGGLAFGTLWLALLGIFYMSRPPERIPPGGLLVTACLAFILVGGINVQRRHTMDIERYAIKRTMPAMAAADWWQTDWQRMAVHRIGLSGEPEEPLTFQWAGGLQGLQDVLLSKGWRRPISWTPSSAVRWLSTEVGPAGFPVIPSLAGGRFPSLTLIKLRGDGNPTLARFVLRLWPADIELNGRTPSPLWIGSIVEERLRHPLSLFTLAWTQPDMNMPRDELVTALDAGRLVSRMDGKISADWDRRVLLVRERDLSGME